MSYFSDLLSLYIKESPYNIKHLANESQLDRTIIQKYISGNRFPSSYSNIEKIISHLTLTNQQKCDLKKAYHIEKFGIEQYQYLLKIKSIIENMHLIEPISFSTEYQFEINKSFALNLEELLTFTHMLLDDAQKTNHKLKICLPTSNKLYKLIKNAVCLNDSLSLDHLLYLENDTLKYKDMYNLIQFENCFPTLLSNKCIIKYMYLQSISTLETKNMYPYSIHSQNYSLLINSQLNLGILLKNDINQHLRLQFDKTFNNAYFYNHYYQSNLGYLSLHSLFNNKLHTYFLLQRKPGILFALDKDMIDRHFIGNNDQYQELLNYLNHYKKHITNILSSHELHFYFTRSGLLEFIKSGISYDLPLSLMTPFDNEEINFILHRLVNINKHYHNFYLHLIKEDFKIPSHCSIAYQQDNEILFILKDEQHYHGFILDETTIKKEFFNLKHLMDIENFVYSEKETIQFLKEFI